MKQLYKIIFLVIGFLTVLEFCFVQGMFTGPLMLGLSALCGLVCVVIELCRKNISAALLYLLCTAALSMGYLNLLGMF